LKCGEIAIEDSNFHPVLRCENIRLYGGTMFTLLRLARLSKARSLIDNSDLSLSQAFRHAPEYLPPII
jgi:hypothetical protein